MTTAIYSTTIIHNTAAAFAAWGSALSAAMQACGLSQTSDTGQINWSTVSALPATNTAGGYEIYKFTDTLQSTSPIYLKIEYGTGNGTGIPAVWITVGTGSNGSGTITGNTIPRTAVFNTSSTSLASNVIAYPTYVCFNGSYLGVVLKNGSTYYTSGYPTAAAVFMLGRGTDTTGSYVANEVILATTSASNNNWPQATMQCLNTATGSVYSTTTGTFTCAWFSPTYTSVNGSNFQVYPCWSAFNQAEPINWMLFGLTAEVAPGAAFTATPFGSVQHTYLVTGNATYGWGIPAGTTTYSIAMLWE